MKSRVLRLLLLLLGLAWMPSTVTAQSGINVVLSPLQIGNFPRISAYAQIYDEQGNFLSGVAPDQVEIIEDSASLPVMQWLELQTGVQFVLAINPGPSLAIRDVNGIARFDYLRQDLTTWIEALEEPATDDWSLVTTDGYEHLHLPEPQTWLERLIAYEGDLRTTTPSLDVLARAIEIATDPAPRPGMGRAVLLITPPPDRAAIAALQSLVARAQQEQVRLFIWQVSAPESFGDESAEQLIQAADLTNGDYFAFSGPEELPDPETYLRPLRWVYQLQYTSQVQVSGDHQVTLAVNTNNQSGTSNPQSFTINLKPPNPIFLSLPLDIVRANRTAIGDALGAEADFTPKSATIKILVEFPDGRPRPLTASRLWVDGEIVAENSAEPFDTFQWDLTPYTSSGEHLLQVEVEDSLGLTGQTIQTSLAITIQQTPQSVVTTLVRNGPVTVSMIVALTGSLVLLILIISGRLRPREFGRLRPGQKKGRKNRKPNQDPVTQPVPVKPLPRQRAMPGWRSRISWPQRENPAPAPAYLELEPGKNGGAQLQPHISLQSPEITIGKDATRASLVFQENSLDDLHARLYRDQAGDYYLRDENSVGGTWVNYQPVAATGTKLLHGDIIQFGRLTMRFKLTDPQQIPKPIVKPLEPAL
ncbi:MAG: FHA domain-containing protein [Anaerolineales bacterium]|nr:FHA domain-containing protein [Anaerolineales bacterium]